ncbi:unnamed protein product, partial [Ectocarpus sp. 12 AP-2014]
MCTLNLCWVAQRAPSVSFPRTLDLAAQVQAREIPDSE